MIILGFNNSLHIGSVGIGIEYVDGSHHNLAWKIIREATFEEYKEQYERLTQQCQISPNREVWAGRFFYEVSTD